MTTLCPYRSLALMGALRLGETDLTREVWPPPIATQARLCDDPSCAAGRTHR